MMITPFGLLGGCHVIAIVVKVAFVLCKSLTGPGTGVKNRLYNSHMI